MSENLQNLNITHEAAKPGTRATFQLIYEGRTLDPTVHADWMLAGRCLRYAEDTTPPTGLNRFQVWVNWTEQKIAKGAVEVVDLPGMASLWADFNLQRKINNAHLSGMNRFGKFQDQPPAPSAHPAPREVVQLKVKRLNERAIMPTYATPGSACFDIYAILELEGEAAISTMNNPTVTLDTGLAFEVPEGWVMKVYSRSGQGFKDNTRLANCVGIIDSDYRGELRVKLTRDDAGALLIRHGDRVAQAMLERVTPVVFIEVDELSETVRGEGAYGSTGR